jgi:hypothetical protein
MKIQTGDIVIGSLLVDHLTADEDRRDRGREGEEGEGGSTSRISKTELPS